MSYKELKNYENYLTGDLIICTLYSKIGESGVKQGIYILRLFEDMKINTKSLRHDVEFILCLFKFVLHEMQVQKPIIVESYYCLSKNVTLLCFTLCMEQNGVVGRML